MKQQQSNNINSKIHDRIKHMVSPNLNSDYTTEQLIEILEIKHKDYLKADEILYDFFKYKFDGVIQFKVEVLIEMYKQMLLNFEDLNILLLLAKAELDNALKDKQDAYNALGWSTNKLYDKNYVYNKYRFIERNHVNSKEDDSNEIQR